MITSNWYPAFPWYIIFCSSSTNIHLFIIACPKTLLQWYAMSWKCTRQLFSFPMNIAGNLGKSPQFVKCITLCQTSLTEGESQTSNEILNSSASFGRVVSVWFRSRAVSSTFHHPETYRSRSANAWNRVETIRVIWLLSGKVISSRLTFKGFSWALLKNCNPAK